LLTLSLLCLYMFGIVDAQATTLAVTTSGAVAMTTNAASTTSDGGVTTASGTPTPASPANATSANSTSVSPKPIVSPVWGQFDAYVVTVHMLAYQLPDPLMHFNATSIAVSKLIDHQKAVFTNLNVDIFARVVVNGSFAWAASLGEQAYVAIFLEISNGQDVIYSGYATGASNNQPLTYPYMLQRAHVTPYFEFLMVGQCLKNTSMIQCGEVVVAGVNPTGCTDCEPVTQICSNTVPDFTSVNETLSYCMLPTAGFTDPNVTRTPDITIYMAWEGQDAHSNTYSSVRSLPSAFDRYSLAPVSNTLNLIANDVTNLF